MELNQTEITDNIKESENRLNPLVSIIVITYNSAKYVLETLESAKTQTYRNIELIITDDFSTDDTVTICENWLEENKDYFKRTKLITVEKNTGIPANCNRGLYNSKGEWIKVIAGDDALMNDCIKDNTDFVGSDPAIAFCFSLMNSYENNFEAENLILEDRNRIAFLSNFSKLNNKFQLKIIEKTSTITAPATFINRIELIKLGGFDESFTFIEDWTTWYRWSKNGNKFYFLPKKTVKYRVHKESVTNKLEENSSNVKFEIKLDQVVRKFFYNNYTFKEKVLYNIRFKYYNYFFRKNNTKLFFKIYRRICYYAVELTLVQESRAINNIFSEYNKKFIKS